MDLQQQKKLRIARLSIISNTTLMILKLATGLVIGSVSIISEAIHSGVDLLAAIIAYAAVKTSGKPADHDHPFGHGKIENISGTIEAFLIFLAAGWIIYEAVKKIIHPIPIEALSWGVGVMLFSSIVNWIVSHMLFTVGEETDSIALKADAWHLRTDVYTSLGVMFGLFIIWIGKYFRPDLSLQWIDPIAALAVAILIIRAAYKLTVQSARDLMDTKLPADEENHIRYLIASMYPKVHGYHRLRTRKAGSDRFIEFHMKVAPDMTVEDSHNITHEIKQQIVEHFPESSVTIHVEPCDGKCQSDCLKHCLLSEDEQKKVRQQTGFQKN
ncbi:MAG: cation transporter [Deltaproteobacteria bacterium]|nr:cation transporter [Deltaproteobacteria bacterium]